MPTALSKGKTLSYEETTAIMDKVYPFGGVLLILKDILCRRMSLQYGRPSGPCAAALACLLPDNWKPPAEWKDEVPAKTLDEMEGYLIQP